MRSSTLIAAFAAGLALATDPVPGTTGELGAAAIVQGNPKDVTYQAILPNKNTTGVRGYIAGISNANGTGVVFNINFYGFPDFETFGPFSKLPLSPLIAALNGLRSIISNALRQSTTFTTSPYQPMVTAPTPRPI